MKDNLKNIPSFLSLSRSDWQEKEKLQVLLRNLPSRDLVDFCSSLLSNQIGGPSSHLRVSLNLPPQRQTVLELLVHLGSVLLCGNPLLLPLNEIAFQPANATVSHRSPVCSSADLRTRCKHQLLALRLQTAAHLSFETESLKCDVEAFTFSPPVLVLLSNFKPFFLQELFSANHAGRSFQWSPTVAAERATAHIQYVFLLLHLKITSPFQTLT